MGKWKIFTSFAYHSATEYKRGVRSFGHNQVMQAGQAVFGVDTGMQVRARSNSVAVNRYHYMRSLVPRAIVLRRHLCGCVAY